MSKHLRGLHMMYVKINATAILALRPQHSLQFQSMCELNEMNRLAKRNHIHPQGSKIGVGLILGNFYGVQC